MVEMYALSQNSNGIIAITRQAAKAQGLQQGKTPIASGREPRPLGFTLIELLIVLGTIGLLVSLLFPALSRAKAQARQVKCTGNLHQLGIALMLYTQDHKRFPYYNSRGIEPGPRTTWQEYLATYYGVGWWT